MQRLKMLATECGIGSCPTIIKDKDSDRLVVIGKLEEDLLSSDMVRAKTGEGEAAVVISLDLIMSTVNQLVRGAA